MKHGTMNTYNRGGCRCDLCKAARVNYKRELLADPRVRAAHNRREARRARLGTAARRWLEQNRPDVLQTLEREVA